MAGDYEMKADLAEKKDIPDMRSCLEGLQSNIEERHHVILEEREERWRNNTRKNYV